MMLVPPSYSVSSESAGTVVGDWSLFSLPYSVSAVSSHVFSRTLVLEGFTGVV